MTTEESPFVTVVLDRLKFGTTDRFPEAVKQHSRVLCEKDITGDHIVRMQSYFYGAKRELPLEPHPATWWDHFKRDAIPTFTRWFGLRVAVTRQILSAGTIYPDIPMGELPGARRYFHEFRTEEE